MSPTVQRPPPEGDVSTELPSKKGARVESTSSTANQNGGNEGGQVGREEEQWFQLKHNTSVYVMGLPDGATEGEVAEEFSRCGVIKQNEDGTPKVKLYR
jgi:RNA recognition motif-containing protein